MLKLQEKKQREPEISFNAMEGTTSLTALRLVGVMNTKPVSILIDVGSTQNFVDLRIMQRTGSPILSEPAFKVIVAGGGKMCSQGVCKIQCQEAELTTDLHLLPIGGYWIVLGIDSPLTLDEVSLNYKDQVVRICKGGKTLSLKGYNLSPCKYLKQRS